MHKPIALYVSSLSLTVYCMPPFAQGVSSTFKSTNIRRAHKKRGKETCKYTCGGAQSPVGIKKRDVHAGPQAYSCGCMQLVKVASMAEISMFTLTVRFCTNSCRCSSNKAPTNKDFTPQIHKVWAQARCSYTVGVCL